MVKYFQISQKIMALIRGGELLPGMRIPSENELIKKYKVSNTTARKVLNELESTGIATRIKGKGTFVRARTVEKSVTRILGFGQNMRQEGFVPSTQVLESKVIRGGCSMTISGRFYAIRGPVFRVKRLRFANNLPIMLEVRFISMKHCPGIEKKDLRKSLYRIYDSYGVTLTEVNQMLSVIVIGKDSPQNYFDLKQDTPAFLVTGVTFCGKENILELEESIYRGDEYSFSVRAT
jgi:GntR family transcriptional regulator